VEFSNVGGGDRIGGALRLEGRARHDTWVQDVLVRVLDPAVAPPGNFIIEDSSLLDDYTMDVSKNWAAQGWMKASLTSSGPDVNWSIDLNTTGILNPAGAATEREITIEAVAWEPGNLAHTIRGEAGGVRAVTIKFASGIPEFVTEYRIVQPADPAANTALETLWTTGTAYTEQSLGGSFTMIAKVRYRDETPGGERRLDRIRWHDDAMGGVFAANNLLGATSGAPVRASESAVRVGGYWEYLIAVNVDTTQTSAVFSIPQGTRFADKAGVYTITIEAQETMGINAFRAQKSFPLRIDNFYPVGKYTGHYYAVGTNYSLQGAAWDAGLTAPGNWKIKQVMVYFTNPAAGNAFVPVTPGTPVTATENIPVVTGRTNESVPGTIVPTLKTVPKINHTTHKHAGIIIDRQETSDSTGSSGNGNGFLEGFRDTTLTVDTGAAPPSAVVTGKEWSVLFDTTRLPDGPLTLHYIVFDEAGHASYYETTLVVRNSVPEISKVVLGTNLLKEGMSAPSHENEYSRNFETTNFTVRNKFLSVKVYVDKGNAPLHYKLSYITAENLNVQVNGADFVQGNVYAIQSPGTSTDWARLGVSGTPDVGKLFYAAVNGEAGLGDGLVKSFNLSLARTAQDLNASSRLPYAEFTFNGGGADAFGGGAIPNSWANAGEITNPTKQNTVKFLFSVYDSVDTRSSATNPETGAAENPASQHWLQLAAHQIIALNVGNNDLLDPLSRLYDVNPFTEIAVGDNDTETITNAATPEWIGGNMNKGGLYNTGESGEFKPSGHVEPRAIGTNDAGRTAENVALREPGAQATFTRDTLSGKVILRGRAFDEQRVKDVYLDIAAGTAAPAVNRQILGAKAADDGYLESKVAGKVFFVEEKTFSGHTVEWAYIWDTETEPGSGLLNGEVTLRASAEDAADPAQHTNGGGSAALNTANQQNYNAITVELAPFVTGVRRTGDPSWVTKRSKQGWYSLSRGETFAVTGYNFPASGAPALQLNSASLGTVTRTSSNEVITTSGLPSAGSASKGGRLALNFGGAQVVNDRKARLNPWNREAAGGIPGSELWDDVRYLHVWNSNAPGTGTNRGYIEGSGSAWDPSITVDPANGDLHAAWAFPGNQQMFIGSNFGPKYEIFKGSDNGYMTDIYFNNMAKTGGVTTYGGSFNNRVGPTVAYFIENTESGNYDGSSSTNWAYYGGVAVFDRFAPNTGISSVTGKGYVVGGIYWWKHSGTGDTTSGPGDRANKVDRFHTNIKTVSAMKGTAEMVYASFYDKYTHSLVFSMTTVGSTNLASQRRITETTANQGNFFVDGSSSDVAVGATAASDVGAYNAIDVDSNGRPVIAYYDATVGTVKIAYATDDTCRNWTKGYALRTGDPLFYGSGTYITMKIARTAVNGDPANTIHLAFVNKNTNSLVYAKGTTARVGPAGGSFDTALVDGSLRVGPLAQISLDANGRPWISYQDTSRANLTEGMKIAYLDPGLYRKNAWDENGQNVSGWETLTVPTRYRVASSDTLNHPRLGMETRPAGLTEAAVPWDGAVAYLAPDYFRIAYYQKPPAPTLFPGSP
jgi:hypothetical protein